MTNIDTTKDNGRIPNFPLRSDTPLGAELAKLGISHFRPLAEMVWSFRYGRNMNAESTIAVIREKCGTCSSKHRFLAAVAKENRTNVYLILSLYIMNEENTPGVGVVLDEYGLESIPEAHCYLRHNNQDFDLTVPPGESRAQVEREYLNVRIVDPDELTFIKKNYHKSYIAEWVGKIRGGKFTADEIWRIREQCIAALSM